MFSIKKEAVPLSDTFFTNLVSKLHHPDNNAIRRAAREALALLKAVNRDTLSPCQFNIHDLTAIDAIEGLDDATKRKLCKEMTKVFVGRCCSLPALFDQAVEAQYTIGTSPWTFGRRPTALPIAKLNENLHLIYEILSRAGNVSSAHIEEISAEGELMCRVHAVTKELPPGSDLGKVIEICRSLPELLVDLMAILFEVDQNRNIEALASAVSLFRGTSNYSYLLTSLRGIPKEERSDVINKAAPLRGLPNVIRAVGAIPADDRESVVSFVTQLIKDFDSEKGLVTLVRVIRAIPKEERKDVIDGTKLLTHDKDSAEERAYIIFALSNIPTGECIDAAAPLIRQGDNAFDRMKIIEAMAQAPSEDRMYIAGKTTLFIDEHHGCLFRARVVKAIIDIPKEHREDAIDKALFFINREKDRVDGVSILKGLGSLSREEHAHVFSLALPLIRDIDNYKSFILDTLIDIPEAIRAEVVREVEVSNDPFKLCQDMRRISDLKSLPPEESPEILAMLGNIATEKYITSSLQDIRKIPKEERAEIYRLAMPLFDGDESVIQRVQMFKAIAGIPKIYRTYTMSRAARLIGDRYPVYDFLDIQKTIRRISIDDLEDATLKTLLCIDKDSTSRNWILEAIAGISARDREDLLDKVLPLLKDKRDSFNIARMLKAMGALTQQGRADVVSVTQSVIKESDSAQCVALVLTIFAGILEGDRADVLSLAVSFNKESDGTWGSAILAQEIGRIPKEERSDVVAKAKLLVKEDDDYNRRAEILKAIKLFPREERDNAILVTKALMKEGDNCVVFLEAISTIPQVEWADVIEKMVILVQEGVDFAHIIEAIGGIPKEDRSDVIEKTVNLVQEGADSAHVIEAIGGIPKEDRSDVIDKAHLFFKLVYTMDTIYIPSSAHLAKVIKKIGTIPKEERIDVLNTAASLINDDYIESCYCILDAISGLPQEERANFAHSTPLLMAGIRLRDGKMVFLGLLSRLPNYSEEFIRECLIICNSEKISLNNYEAFRLVPQFDFLGVVTEVAKDPNTIHGQFWKDYCLMNSLIQEGNLEQASAIFDMLEGDGSVQFAHWIIRSAYHHLIDQNHSLVQKALTAILPEDTNDE